MKTATANTRKHLAWDCALLLLIAVVPAAPTWWRVHAGKGVEARDPWSMRVDRARELRNGMLWIDARAADRFAAGHIPGAKPLELAEWNRQLPGIVGAWRPGLTVVVYCDAQGCDASREVATRLRRNLHLPQVFFLEGGWDAWKASEP